MSTEHVAEFTVSDDFHKKLRYFNEMVGEIHSLLALEPGDLRGTQEAERDIAAQLVRHRAAAESVAQARMALEVSEQLLARVTAEMRLATQQGRALAEATIEAVEARPQVRPMYKAGLRDIFETGTKSETGIGFGTEAPTKSFVPYALKVDEENGNTILKWLWQGAWSNTLRFEVAAATGSLTVYRGTATATDGQNFVTLGTTEPGAEMIFPFRLDAAIKDGVPVIYRVRALLVNGAVSEWSEPYRVLHTSPGEVPEPGAPANAEKATRGGIFSALFEYGAPRVRN